MKPGSAWLGLFAAVSVCSVVLAPAGPFGAWASQLSWQADHWIQAPWTLWSASVVHLSMAHLGANLLGLGAVGVLGYAMGAGRLACLALLLAWPLSHLGLLAWAQVGACSGLSGLLHAGTAVLGMVAVRRLFSRAIDRILAVMVPGGLLLKLALEHPWSTPLLQDADWGFTVVQASHLTGAAAGALCALSAVLPDLLHQRRG